MEAPQPLCSLFQFPTSLTIKYVSLCQVIFPVLQLSLLLLITQHLLLNICRKLLGPSKATSAPGWPSPAPPASPYKASMPIPPFWRTPLNSLQLINAFPALQVPNWAQMWPQKSQKGGRNHFPQLANARAYRPGEEDHNWVLQTLKASG